MAINWDLSGCCNQPTIVFLCLYGGYSLFTMFFMNWKFVKPMKLISIFIHEMGHASAAWLTGGKVDKIEVYENEGGVTNFRNGWKPAIIPAGYVGVSFWGKSFNQFTTGESQARATANEIICSQEKNSQRVLDINYSDRRCLRGHEWKPNGLYHSGGNLHVCPSCVFTVRYMRTMQRLIWCGTRNMDVHLKIQ